MDAGLRERLRAALERWQAGDLSPLEPLLDADAELLWWEPGEWDCHGREAVLAALRERRASGLGRAKVELTEVGDALIVSRTSVVRSVPEAGTRPATLVTFRDGKVISMRQFRSREEALAAAG